MIDVTRRLDEPVNADFNQKLNLRMEEYLRGAVQENSAAKFRLKDTDVQASTNSSASVPKGVQDWMSRHPAYTTRKASIRDWK
jgi:hypothetical protein